MNMGMTMVPNPMIETKTNTKFKEHPLQIQKQIHKVRVYVDKENDRYYLDYYTFEELATQFTVNGEIVYDLGNNTYKGDLKGHSVTIGEHSGLLPISHRTLEVLKEAFNNEIDYVDLDITIDKDRDFNFEFESNNENTDMNKYFGEESLNPKVDNSELYGINNESKYVGVDSFNDINQIKL